MPNGKINGIKIYRDTYGNIISINVIYEVSRYTVVNKRGKYITNYIERRVGIDDLERVIRDFERQMGTNRYELSSQHLIKEEVVDISLGQLKNAAKEMLTDGKSIIKEKVQRGIDRYNDFLYNEDNNPERRRRSNKNSPDYLTRALKKQADIYSNKKVKNIIIVSLAAVIAVTGIGYTCSYVKSSIFSKGNAVISISNDVKIFDHIGSLKTKKYREMDHYIDNNYNKVFQIYNNLINKNYDALSSENLELFFQYINNICKANIENSPIDADYTIVNIANSLSQTEEIGKTHSCQLLRYIESLYNDAYANPIIRNREMKVNLYFQYTFSLLYGGDPKAGGSLYEIVRGPKASTASANVFYNMSPLSKLMILIPLRNTAEKENIFNAIYNDDALTRNYAGEGDLGYNIEKLLRKIDGEIENAKKDLYNKIGISSIHK